MKSDIWQQGREIGFKHLTSVKNVGLLICVDSDLTRVVWQTSKLWRYYADLTWKYFGAATLQGFVECWAMKSNW